MVRREDELAPGGIRSSEDLTEEERHRLEDLFRKEFFAIGEMQHFERHAAGCDAVVHVTYTEHRRASSDHARSRTVYQTVAYFDRPQADIPSFSAQPVTGVMGSMIGGLMNFMGMPTVEVPDQPEFNRRFHVLSFHPQSTRRLLARPTAQLLLRHSDLTVKAGGGCVAIFRDGKTVDESEMAPFFASAREVAQQIITSADELPAEHKPSGEEAVQAIEGLSGWVGNRLRSQLITRWQIEDTLTQPPPRSVPKSIRHRAYGSSRFLMLFGAMFMLIGAILTGMMFVVTSEEIPVWVPFALLGAPLIGLTVFTLAARYLWRRRRILHHGMCQQAEIIDVKAADVYINGERQYDLTLAAANTEWLVRVGSGPASNARSIRQRGESVRLLVDPATPSRALWIEGWAMEGS